MDHTQAMHASDIITRHLPRKHCQCLVDENINEKDGNDDDEGLLTHVPFYRKSPLIELKLKIAGSFNSVGPKGYSPKSCPTHNKAHTLQQFVPKIVKYAWCLLHALHFGSLLTIQIYMYIQCILFYLHVIHNRLRRVPMNNGTNIFFIYTLTKCLCGK